MSGAIGIDFDTKAVTMAYCSSGKWVVREVQTKSYCLIWEFLDYARHDGVIHAALEKPYLATFKNKSGEKKQAVRTFGELSEIYGQIKLLCLQARFERANIVPALPMVWMRAMLAQGGHMPTDLEGRKQVSVMRAQSMDVPGVHIDHWKDCHDRADAALICDWLRIRLEGAEV